MGCCNSKNDEIIIPSVDANLNPNTNFITTERVGAEKIRSESKFTINEVKLCKATPRDFEKQIFEFMCPICMYYYSTVLITKCCKNYICHYCVEEMKARNNKFSCPHCLNPKLVLRDPKPEDNIRKYLDSAR